MGPQPGSAIQCASKWRNLMTGSRCASGALSFLVFLPMVVNAQRAQENVVPLKNWATPLVLATQPDGERGCREGRSAATIFRECRVHQRSHVRGDHALPAGGYSRRRGRIQRDRSFFGAVHSSQGNSDHPGAILHRSQRQHRARALRCDSFHRRKPTRLTSPWCPRRGARSTTCRSGRPAGTQPFVATLNDPQGAIVANAAIVPAGTPVWRDERV